MGVHQLALECFDADRVAVMGVAMEAAIATVRLAGIELDDENKLEMARRILRAMRESGASPLELVEAALDGPWR